MMAPAHLAARALDVLGDVATKLGPTFGAVGAETGSIVSVLAHGLASVLDRGDTPAEILGRIHMPPRTIDLADEGVRDVSEKA